MLHYAKVEYVAMALALASFLVTGLVVVVVSATLASRASLAGRPGSARTAVAGIVWGVMIAASPFVVAGVVYAEDSANYEGPVRSSAMLLGLVTPVILARLAAIVALSTPEPSR